MLASAGVVLTTGYLGFLAGHPWLPASAAVGISLGLAPVSAISLWDDVHELRAWIKLLAQIAGAVTAVSFGVALSPTVHLFVWTVHLGWFALPISVVWLVGVTNAFNLIDGLDGLSAGLALISSATLVAVYMLAGDIALASAVAVIAGAILGFLPYNLYPARIFLGDLGAASIGFTLGCFTLIGTARLSAGFATLMPVMLLGVPVADTLVAIARRTIARAGRESTTHVYEPDQNHIHHRLLAMGVGHRSAVFVLYGVGAVCACLALVSLLLTSKQAALLLAGTLVAGFVGLGRLRYDEFAVIRSGVLVRFYDAPVLRRSFFVVFIDLAIVVVAVYVAVGLKYDNWTLTGFRERAVTMGTVLMPLNALTLHAFGLYRGSWRLAGIDDYRRLCVAIGTAASLGFVGITAILPQEVPLSLVGIYALVMLVMSTGGRVSYRLLQQARWRATSHGTATLIYGAGIRGVGALKEMLSNPATGMKPAGFIDDNPAMAGKLVDGLPVFGALEMLERSIAQTRAEAVVISPNQMSSEKEAEAKTICDRCGVRLMRMTVSFQVVSIPALSPNPDPTAGKRSGTADSSA